MVEANRHVTSIKQEAEVETAAGPNGQDAVAIIGMSCLFPGAPNLDAYWHNILNKVDAVTDPPPEAWDPDVYYDADFADTDRVYCKRGGYLGSLVSFDPLPHGIPPVAVGGEPDQWLALQLAQDALADAGRTELPEHVRRRTAVILGKGTYLNGGNALAVERGLVIGQTLEIIKRLHPEYTKEQLERLRHEMKQTLPPMNAETVPGLIPNIIVGRIANRLDLMGPTYTVDAACASSLVGIQLAIRDLRTGECDLALVGGAQVWVPVPTLNIFCRLGALSRRQQIRPFDKDADGTLLGEGIGMIVLKRLADAERDGDRIYASIMGVGTSSDGRGMSVMAPRVEGEELALRRAYESTGISPSTVTLVEAHGTGTPVGDVVEVQALTRVFGERNGGLPPVALGTVKSMISHTMPAAGIAGIIKTALALYHKVLPPTLNVTEPNPKLELNKTPFYLNTETRPWVHGGSSPRRAGVNAFGFGGINAHVVMQEYAGTPQNASNTQASNRQQIAAALPNHQPVWESEVCILEGETRVDLLRQVHQLMRYLGAVQSRSEAADRGQVDPTRLKDLAYSLNCNLGAGQSSIRLAIVANSFADLQTKLSQAEKRLADPDCRRIKDVKGIYFAARPLAREGKVAVLFPGEGAQYPNMLADLCIHFPEIRECFDQADRVFFDHPRGYLLSDYLFPRPAFTQEERQWAEHHLMQMNGAVEAIITANQAMNILLQRIGVKPDVILGHSTGEYSAIWASGILDLHSNERITQFSQALHGYYEDVAEEEGVSQAVLLAVGAERDRVEALAREAGGEVYLAMDNCPHQAVLVGERAAVDRATELVRREGFIYEQLGFDRAYHTKLFASCAERLRPIFARLPIHASHTPVYSCATVAPYPSDPSAIRELLIEQWSRPVEFRRTIEMLYDEGVRIFVEAGPRGNLSAFLEDILRGKECAIVPANVQRRSGITQLNHLVAILAVQGVDLDLAYLYQRREPLQVDWMADPDSLAPASPSVKIPLTTGWPMLRLPEDAARELRQDTVHRAVPNPDPRPPLPGTATHKLTETAQPVPDAALPPQPVEHQPYANGRSHELVSQHVAPPTHPAVAGADDDAAVAAAMQNYLQTMEQFVALQEQVMQAYLARGESPERLEAPAAPVWVQPETPPVPNDHPQEPEATPAAPAPVAPPPAAPVFNADPQRRVGDQLRELVSERTGYPIEMLDWHLDLEADLGIDSIKRVEIFGTFRQRFGAISDDILERLTSQRTLQQIVDVLVAGEQPDTDTDLAAAREIRTSSVDVTAPAPSTPLSYPLLGKVIAWEANEELICERSFDLTEDLYLRDHTFGGAVSTIDPDLFALAVMPLTMSLEIVAEAAACLMPGMTVVGLRDVQAHRWLAWDEQPQTLQVTARRLAGDSSVRVQIRSITEDRQSDNPPKSPALEARVMLGNTYSSTSGPTLAKPVEGRASRIQPDQLYTGVMFHGPTWQGVTAIKETGPKGIAARLQVLPFTRYLQSTPTPNFVLDPAVLDAAGQVIGFWTAEHLVNGQVIFPFRVEAIEVFGPQRPVGEELTCVAAIELMGDQQVRSDIEVTDANGSLWMRIVGWEDKRFELPDPFRKLLLVGSKSSITTPWPEPIARLSPRGQVACRRAPTNLASDRALWMRVWAQRILGRAERVQFRSLRSPERRRFEWIAGRAAAKDAILHLLEQAYGLSLLPADIEIAPDEHGQLVVGGDWQRSFNIRPVVSVSHTENWAVALAGIVADAPVMVGIDIEDLHRQPESFAATAFTGEERRLLDRLPPHERQEWALRCWCAKEAVGKALGRGLMDGLDAVTLIGFDPDGEWIEVRLTGQLAAQFPELAATTLSVYTTRHDGLVAATTLCEPVDARILGDK